MARSLVPKKCWVRYIQIHSKGADVGYDCDGPGSGGRGSFPTPDGGTGNYPIRRVKGVRSVAFRGVTVSGHGADMGFVLSPAHATCTRQGKEISCRLKGDTSSPSLSGVRGRKRKKGRRR